MNSIQLIINYPIELLFGFADQGWNSSAESVTPTVVARGRGRLGRHVVRVRDLGVRVTCS